MLKIQKALNIIVHMKAMHQNNEEQINKATALILEVRQNLADQDAGDELLTMLDEALECIKIEHFDLVTTEAGLITVVT